MNPRPHYLQPAKASLKRKKGLRRVSKRRPREAKEYAKLRDRLLMERPICELWLAKNEWRPVGECYYAQGEFVVSYVDLLRWGAPRSTTCHHSRGRGRYYIDYSTFKALSMEGHQWVEAHPKEAMALGLTSPLKNVRSSFRSDGG